MVGFDDDTGPEGVVDLQDAIHGRPSAVRRIGIGLRALCNHVLLERIPARFTELLHRLERAEQRSSQNPGTTRETRDDTPER